MIKLFILFIHIAHTVNFLVSVGPYKGHPDWYSFASQLEQSYVLWYDTCVLPFLPIQRYAFSVCVWGITSFICRAVFQRLSITLLRYSNLASRISSIVGSLQPCGVFVGVFCFCSCPEMTFFTSLRGSLWKIN